MHKNSNLLHKAYKGVKRLHLGLVSHRCCTLTKLVQEKRMPKRKLSKHRWGAGLCEWQRTIDKSGLERILASIKTRSEKPQIEKNWPTILIETHNCTKSRIRGLFRDRCFSRVLFLCLFGVSSLCQTSRASFCAETRCQFVVVDVVIVTLRKGK